MIRQYTDISQFYNNRFEFGLALCIMALPIGWSIGQILNTPSGMIVNILMLVAVICLFDTQKKFKFSMNKLTIGFLIYQIIVIIYILCTCKRNLLDEILYNGYVIVVSLAICTQNKNKKFKNLINYFMVMGVFIIFVTLFFATNSFSTFVFTSRFSLADSYDPLTLSDRILVAMLAICLLNSKNKIIKLLKIFLLFLGFICLIATNVRKTFIAIILILLVNTYYVFKHRGLKIRLNKIIKYIIGISVFIIFLPSIIEFLGIFKGIFNQFEILIERMLSGIYTFLGVDVGYLVDPSAMTRVTQSSKVINRLFTEDGILQLLLGHGYIDTYVDIPILQAFSDMGIILGSVYVFYGIIYPALIILNFKGTEDNNIKFIKLLAVPTFIGQLVAGVPYGYRLWLPIVFLIILTSNSKVSLIKLKE